MRFTGGIILFALAACTAASGNKCKGCTDMVWPVCGSNGVTYNNPCVFQCAVNEIKGLTFRSYGKCKDTALLYNLAVQKKSFCSCDLNLLPVCGTNHKTYTNECLMKCEDENVEVAHKGFCPFNKRGHGIK